MPPVGEGVGVGLGVGLGIGIGIGDGGEGIGVGVGVGVGDEIGSERVVLLDARSSINDGPAGVPRPVCVFAVVSEVAVLEGLVPHPHPHPHPEPQPPGPPRPLQGMPVELEAIA